MSDDLDFDMEVVKNEDLGSSETDNDPNSSESTRPGIEKLDGERAESSGDKRRIGRKESTGSSSSATDAVEEKEGPSGEPQGPELIDGVLWSKINCVPDGWDLVNLGPEVSIQTGYNAPSENFVDEGGIPLIRNRDLGSSETEIQYDGDYGDEYVIEEGDLLVSMDGEFEPHLWTGGKALLNQRVCKVEGSESFNHIFLTYAIEKPLYLLQKSIAGTTVKHLSKSNIRSVNLPTPPLPEQRKIASVLYAVDQAIQKTEEIIEQTKLVRRGAVQKLLSGRATDFTSERHEFRIGPKSKLLPSDWQVLPLGEVAEVSGGKRLPKGHGYADRKTDYPYLRVTDMKGGSIDPDDLEYLTENTYQEISKYTISSDDVYISIAGTIGIAGVVPKSLDGANLTENAAKIHELDGVDRDYLALYLQSKLGQDEIFRMTVGSSQPKLSLFRIKSLEVVLPPLAIQEKISSVVKGFDRKILSERKYLSRLSSVKQGLMQNLLTGEVRTADRAIEVLEEVQAHG